MGRLNELIFCFISLGNRLGSFLHDMKNMLRIIFFFFIFLLKKDVRTCFKVCCQINSNLIHFDTCYSEFVLICFYSS